MGSSSRNNHSVIGQNLYHSETFRVWKLLRSKVGEGGKRIFDHARSSGFTLVCWFKKRRKEKFPASWQTPRTSQELGPMPRR